MEFGKAHAKPGSILAIREECLVEEKCNNGFAKTKYKDPLKRLHLTCHESELNGRTVVILLVTFLNSILSFGFAGSVGVFHAVFLGQFREANALISVITAVNTASGLTSALFAGILCKKIGYRFTTILGGVLTSSGLVLSVFATSVWHLICTFGILSGIGIGLAYVPPICKTGESFPKYKTIALCFVSLGVGIGPFLFPLLIRYAVATYGWRGSFLIIGGTELHICLMGAMLSPAKTVTDQNQNNFDSETRKIKIVQILKIAFSNRDFLYFCLQNLVMYAGFSAMMIHLSAFAEEELGITFTQSSMLFSYMGCANVFGRVVIGFLAQREIVRKVVIYSVCLSLTGTLTVICGATKLYHFYVFYAIVFGFLTSAISLVPPIVIDIAGQDILPIALGTLMAFEGVGILFGPPLAGWIFDLTGIYAVSLYIAGALMAVSSIALLIAISLEICQRKNH